MTNCKNSVRRERAARQWSVDDYVERERRCVLRMYPQDERADDAWPHMAEDGGRSLRRLRQRAWVRRLIAAGEVAP